jgi:hypothetical protein
MPFIPAILVGLLLIGFNWYFLWEWWSHQLSGDVMIHLVFARNFAEGRWFEYSDGQFSRANTTILWEWILAILGIITGQVRSNEGFMTVARIFAMICVAFTGWRLYRWGRELELSQMAASLTAVFVVLNPMVFYWTAVNPMETCMTLVLTAASAMWVWRTGRADLATGWPAQWQAGLIGGGWIFLLSLIRPEMLALSFVAALAFLFGQGIKRWPLAALLVIVPLALTVMQALALSLGGVPIVPTPNTARRLIALTYDTFPMPLLGIPINPDAWKVLLAWSPLLLASLYTAFLGERRNRPAHFFALGVCGFSALFFSLYYYTTWQGRYMVPALVSLALPAVAAIIAFLNQLPATRHSQPDAALKSLNLKTYTLNLKPYIFLYGLALCALSMWPLARYAQAPYNRAIVEEFVSPPPDARVFLVQEVQSAYFFPHLEHISTEGLITPEATEAYRKGQTLYDFIMELRPDLIAHGRYYLDDPDGLQKKINDAAHAGEDLEYRDLRLTHRGLMLGAGPHFQPEYAQKKTEKN